ncbi:MAG: hypothetical protein RIR12_2244 [Bacteroidota bacterium]
MLYSLVKIAIRVAGILFFNKRIVQQRKFLNQEGPLLIAANHPNSFLDAVVLAMLFKRPIWSLARGDAFKKKWHRYLLTHLKLLPVYREREGVENLGINYQTFDACKQIFKNNGIVLIFSEGLCVNEWHLRPLKKGTARLAISCWKEGIPLKVLPVGLNYSSFKKWGKNVFINLAPPISANGFDLTSTDGQLNLAFTTTLKQALAPLVMEIPTTDTTLQQKMLSVPTPLWVKIVLLLPALLGYVLHAPLYWCIQVVSRKKVKEPAHYDSLMLAYLLLTYPCYLLVMALAAYAVTGSGYAWASLLVLPFLAWCVVKVKPHTDRG